MTTACAECHDHKYDAFTQRDFYSLAAYFADVDDTRTFQGGDTNPTRREPEIEVFEDDDRALLESLTTELEEARRDPDSPTRQARINQLQASVAEVRKRGWAMSDEQLSLGIRSIAVPSPSSPALCRGSRSAGGPMTYGG